MSHPTLRLLGTASFVVTGALVFACGSDDARSLGNGPSTNGAKTDAAATGASTAFMPSTNGGDASIAPSDGQRCTDTTNATEGCSCPTDGAEGACWTGPANLRRVEMCRDGKAICTRKGEFLQWGPCTGEVLPGSSGIDATCQSTCKGECVPGKWRYCDEAQFCAWGKQDCLPNGKGGGSWGPCKETTPPAGCEGFTPFPGVVPPFYEEECCIAKGFCCQVGGVNSPFSKGNCDGIVVTCQ